METPAARQERGKTRGESKELRRKVGGGTRRPDPFFAFRVRHTTQEEPMHLRFMTIPDAFQNTRNTFDSSGVARGPDRCWFHHLSTQPICTLEVKIRSRGFLLLFLSFLPVLRFSKKKASISGTLAIGDRGMGLTARTYHRGVES